MTNQLLIQKFISEHRDDYETLLAQKPYCIAVQHDVVNNQRLVLFKYSQIDSNFNEPMVRECRGLILDEDTLEVVCCPFFKFGNFSESYVPEIDWNTAFVSQKLDGSLIKVTHLKSGQLLISTNGTIDAYKAPLADQIGCMNKNFGWLFEQALERAMIENKATHSNQTAKDWLKSVTEPGYTYMFELTSPFNKVVVKWDEIRAFFIGCRDNTTLQELRFSSHQLSNLFKTPKLYPLKSIDDCVSAAETLGCDEEGYVVCDGEFNRVKVKSPVYVAIHHMHNGGVMSVTRGIEVLQHNEIAEVLTYCPEFSQHLNIIKTKIDQLLADLTTSNNVLEAWIKNECSGDRSLVATGGSRRKDVAIVVSKTFRIPGVGFALLDGKVASIDEWYHNMPATKLVKVLGFKEDPEEKIVEGE